MNVEVTEYGSSVALSIDSTEAEAISKASDLWRQRLKLKERPFRIYQSGPGQFNLEARGVAGFIRVGSITLEIAPKFLNRDYVGPNWRRNCPPTSWRRCLLLRGDCSKRRFGSSRCFRWRR